MTSQARRRRGHGDLEGMRLTGESAPPGMRIAAGEFGYDAFYFRRLLERGAVDRLQADAPPAGITGFPAASNLSEAFATPSSAHAAPSLQAHGAWQFRPRSTLECKLPDIEKYRVYGNITA